MISIEDSDDNTCKYWWEDYNKDFNNNITKGIRACKHGTLSSSRKLWINPWCIAIPNWKGIVAKLSAEWRSGKQQRNSARQGNSPLVNWQLLKNLDIGDSKDTLSRGFSFTCIIVKTYRIICCDSYDRALRWYGRLSVLFGGSVLCLWITLWITSLRLWISSYVMVVPVDNFSCSPENFKSDLKLTLLAPSGGTSSTLSHTLDGISWRWRHIDHSKDTIKDAGRGIHCSALWYERARASENRQNQKRKWTGYSKIIKIFWNLGGNWEGWVRV